MRKCSGENTQGVAGNPFEKEIMGMTHRSKETSQQKPGIEVRLHWREYCQLGNNDCKTETTVLVVKESCLAASMYCLKRKREE